jgi:hypothetical protein
MSSTVKLSDELVDEARRHAHAMSRSLARQIEHWSRIGRIAEANPDLPYAMIQDILLSQEELGDGAVVEYEFG